MSKYAKFVVTQPMAEEHGYEVKDGPDVLSSMAYLDSGVIPGAKHPRLQILTVTDLLGGAGIDYPSRHGNVTFRKAPRLQRDADHEQMEFGGASAQPDDFGDE